MAKRSEFVEWLLEQLSPLGTVRARAMFGAYGLYLDDLFFGLVDEDILYLKVDDDNLQRFLSAGSQPFRYMAKDGKQMSMSYFSPPDSVLDVPADLIDWAREGIHAALRAKSAGGKRKSKKR